MAKEQTATQTEPKKKSAFVHYLNKCPGLLVLPVVGQLSPGWNKVPRAVHEATRRADGTSVIPADAPIEVRDDSLTVSQSEPKAIATVLETNQPQMLDEVLREEVRPAVRAAAEHQKKVLRLEELPSEELQALARSEKREEVLTAISRVVETKSETPTK